MANSKRKCGGCGDYFRPSHEQTFPGPVSWCSPDCGLIVAKKRTPAVKAKQAKAERAQNREAKDKFKANDLPHQKELTRRVCNQMIRMLDAGKCCPTCDEPLIDGRYDAGHVRTVAACPKLRFDPRAIFGQCRSCNGSGTIRKKTRKTQESVSELYKAWVLREQGQEYYDWLYGPHEAKHYSCDDLKELRAVFAAEIRRLESGQGPSRNWRELSIETRKAV